MILLKSTKYNQKFPITNGYNYLQPKLNGCLPTIFLKTSQLCLVEMKQQV